MSFSENDLKRYYRNIILPDVGEKGQMRLKEAKVLLIGVGGLGSSGALYLAASGVGTIGIVDSDSVDLSNLQRQVIHSTEDLDRLKVDSAKEKMEAINPDLKVISCHERVTRENIDDIIRDYDFVIDATDNFEAKFLINDACVSQNKAFSHAGILEFEGQAMTYVPGAACFRCIFKDEPPKGSERGVLGAVAGMLGTVQAAEAIKYILKEGELLVNRLLTVNSLDMSFRNLEIRPSPECQACSQ